MRDYEYELNKRVKWIKDLLSLTKASGIVFGNSGGKDSALCGILCKKATDNVLAVMMPCGSAQNYGSDIDDGRALVDQFGIECISVDLTKTKEALVLALKEAKNETGDISMDGCEESSVHTNTSVRTDYTPSGLSNVNINPRLRMTTLYAIAQERNSLVCGTGNASERFMGYFTKWGDGAFDFNPVSDLTVTEIYEFLEYLKAPNNIIKKAPSAGLYEGQTDEADMGVSYKAIDEYISTGNASDKDKEIIERYHSKSLHKLTMPKTYTDN